MKVPIIVLNYNSSADCRECIADLKRQEGVELEIVIVDNCSPREGERDAIKQLCIDEVCTFIQAFENRGYNAGNNIGLRYAADKGYKYALIANPDMRFPQKDYVARMVDVMEEKPEVAVCGSNIIDVNGTRQNPRCFTPYWNELLWFISGWKRKVKQRDPLILYPHNQYCDILIGSCIFIRLGFVKNIGYFDENVFLYCEEPILGKQVASAGMKMYYLNDAVATHYHIPSKKESFIKRHDIYWKSRWYYLTHYAGYNNLQLILMWISKKFHYSYKRFSFVIKGEK